MLKKIIQFKLKIFAKLVLRKYKPRIIGITGSVGKTSAKEAVYAVLSSRFHVRKNVKNFNNEIGVPLTILGEEESGGKNILKWLLIFFRAFTLIIKKDENYPETLILEMGADRPGDIKNLVDFVLPDIGIVTAVSEVHIEFFSNLKNIAKEKSGIIANLSKDGTAILCADDQLVYEMKDKTKAKVLTFGFSEIADLRALESVISIDAEEGIRGYNFKLSYEGSIVPVLLPGVLGEHQIYAALVGAACGIVYGMNLVQISESFQKYRAPKGRMSLIAGIKHTQIIDDTYNASPKATIEALNTIKKIPVAEGAEKFAVLGDMLELGDYSDEGHSMVGKKVAEVGIGQLITVGHSALKIAAGAREGGMGEGQVFTFDHIDAAGKFLQERIKEGDLILVKGSQGMRMEKIVKEVMAEPLRAEELLTRQGLEWQ